MKILKILKNNYFSINLDIMGNKSGVFITKNEFVVNDDYNQPITSLSKDITTLILGKSFNNKIKFPPRLENLTLGESFNQPLENLPTSLRILIIHGNFNYPLDNLPSNLEMLILNKRYNQPLENLPNNLKILHLTNPHYYHSLEVFPKNLKELSLPPELESARPELKSLYPKTRIFLKRVKSNFDE